MRYSTVGCLIFVACFICEQAHAEPSYTYVTDASSYTGAAGSTVSVKIYLQETGIAPVPGDITEDGGLIAGGAAINFVSNTGGVAAQIPSTDGTFQANDAYFSQPIFQSAVYYDQSRQSSGNPPLYNGNNLEFVLIGSSSGPYPDPDASGRILLGTVQIIVGSATTRYTLTSLFDDTISNGSGFGSALGQVDANTITDSHTDLDGADKLYKDGGSTPVAINGADAAAPDYFTVVVTPEPTSVTLVGIAALCHLARRKV